MFSTCLYLHLFHLAQGAQSPSLLSQMIGYPPVSWLNNIPLCVGTILESLHLDRNSPRAWHYMTSLIMALLLLTHSRYTKNEWGHAKSPPPMPSCLDFSVFLSFKKKIIYLFIFISWRLITLQYCSGFCRFQCVSYSIISLLHWFTINVRCIISWITKKGKMLPVSQATIIQCSLISEILKYGKWWVVKPMKYGITIFDKWMNMKVVYKIYFHSLSVETLYNIWTKTSKKSFHPWFTVEHVS